MWTPRPLSPGETWGLVLVLAVVAFLFALAINWVIGWALGPGEDDDGPFGYGA